MWRFRLSKCVLRCGAVQLPSQTFFGGASDRAPAPPVGRITLFRNRFVAASGGRYPCHSGPCHIDLLGILQRHPRRSPTARLRDRPLSLSVALNMCTTFS